MRRFLQCSITLALLGCSCSTSLPPLDAASPAPPDAWAPTDTGVDAAVLGLPLDAAFDTSRPPPAEACDVFADVEPDRTWDGGPPLANPPFGVSIASDGASFGVVWGEARGRALRFARVAPSGAVLASTVLDPSTTMSVTTPAIAWSGEHYAVSYTTAAGLHWLEVDANGIPLREPEPAGTDECSHQASLLWSGDRWTRLLVTADDPPRAVVVQMFPGGGSTTRVLDEVLPNTCDTVGLAWNGRELAVVWNDWTEAPERMRFLRLDRAGSPVEGSLRTLATGDDDGVRTVQGFRIVWTGSEYVAGGGATPWLRVSETGDVVDVLGEDEVNTATDLLAWTGCDAIAAFVIQPSYSFGYTYVGTAGVHAITLGYGPVGHIASAVGEASEAAFVMQRTNGVFFRSIGRDGPIGDWVALHPTP